MFSKIPALIGREFIIAYYLPSAWFAVSVVYLLNAAGISDYTIEFKPDNLYDQAMMAFVVWQFAIVLASFNMRIVRFFEGYPGVFVVVPFPEFMKRLRREEFRRLIQTKSAYELAAKYPHTEEMILPTRFGNAIRAFEDYAAVIYRIDPIGAWPRIYMLLSSEVRSIVESARATVNMWVNIWMLALLLAVLYVCFVIVSLSIYMFDSWWTGECCENSVILAVIGDLHDSWWVALVAIIVAIVASKQATSAAVEWGHIVKSCFDLYLRDMITRLTGKPQPTEEEMRVAIDAANQAFLYRHRESNFVIPPDP